MLLFRNSNQPDEVRGSDERVVVVELVAPSDQAFAGPGERGFADLEVAEEAAVRAVAAADVDRGAPLTMRTKSLRANSSSRRYRSRNSRLPLVSVPTRSPSSYVRV